MCVSEDDATLGSITKVRIGPPNEKDWKGACVLQFFEMFYLATKKVSANKYPTSHTTVQDVIVVESEIHKLFMPEYDQYFQAGGGVEAVLTDMVVSMRAKYKKHFGSIGAMNQLFILSLVLDPRFKLRHYLHV